MNDDCEIKISDPLSLDNNSNFSKIYSRYSSDRLYLSPEECSALEMESFCVKSSKNDVWTCGIIILEIGLLENQNLCYRANSRKINWVKLNENIYHFGKIYS
jgi:serine/threonine protein kinase